MNESVFRRKEPFPFIYQVIDGWSILTVLSFGQSIILILSLEESGTHLVVQLLHPEMVCDVIFRRSGGKPPPALRSAPVPQQHPGEFLPAAGGAEADADLSEQHCHFAV